MSAGYTQVNLFAIILVGLLLVHSRNSKISKGSAALNKVVISALGMMISDLIFCFINGQNFAFGIAVNYIVEITYFLSTQFLSFYWLLFAIYELYDVKKFPLYQKILVRIPIAFLMFTAISSPFTNWLVIIDSENNYHRGELFMVQIVVCYLYIFIASLVALNQAKSELLPDRKSRCYHVWFYTILPLVGSILQTFLKNFNGAAPMITVCIVMMYLDTIKKDISLDPLTRLNNRGLFDKYLVEKAYAQRTLGLYLIFIDIDKFKMVNDTYGHVEGDKAIIAVANALKKTFAGTGAFISRYGGDEFAVVYESTLSDIEGCLKLLNATVAEISADFPYRLTLSSGYAKMGENGVEKVEDLIKAADNKMYIIKKNKTEKNVKPTSVESTSPHGTLAS